MAAKRRVRGGGKAKEDATANVRFNTQGAAPLTLPELGSHLWQAANILRGSPVDRTDWKSYILPLLFFKRICDVWDEEHAAMLEEYGEDYPDEHRFQVPSSCHWSDVRAAARNVGTALANAMRGIEAANQKHLYVCRLATGGGMAFPAGGLIAASSQFATLSALASQALAEARHVNRNYEQLLAEYRRCDREARGARDDGNMARVSRLRGAAREARHAATCARTRRTRLSR